MGLRCPASSVSARWWPHLDDFARMVLDFGGGETTMMVVFYRETNAELNCGERESGFHP